MKLPLTILSLINAAYMVIDGIHVMVKGKYIGPEKPGPWANIFTRWHIDVFKLGPLFILWGLLWFGFVYGLQTARHWTHTYGLLLALATLWYLPFGTVISILTLFLLAIHKTGLKP